MFTNDRSSLRRQFAEAWKKHAAGEPLDPLQSAIADAIAWHPEYHKAILGSEDALEKDYLPEMGETNPFLHLGLHLGIREQITTDRPAGIRAIHQTLLKRVEPHDAEHRMMECLAETLWEAQRNGAMPDESTYLQRLRRLLTKA